MHTGYHWILRRYDGDWLWKATCPDGRLLAEGTARTRAEGAACLARVMSLATLAAEEGLPA